MERQPQTLAGNQPSNSLCTCTWAGNIHIVVVGPECPLQPRPCVPAGRFVSGLTLPSPHCASCTVIAGRVFGSQAVHLQIGRVLGVVSGDGESALHRVCVVGATTITTTTNRCQRLQPLPWSLADPAYAITTEVESRADTGESQRPPRLHQASSRLHQLLLTLDTCKHKDILVRKLSHAH